MSRFTMEFQRMMDELYGRKSGGTGKKEKPVEQPKVRTPLKRTPLRSSPKTRARRKTEAEVIAEVRTQVFELDAACICGKCKPSVRDEMNEVVPRSKTRRMAPEERFNVYVCVRMSRKCHAMFHGEIGHGKRLKLEFLDPEQRAMGPIRGTFKDGRTFVYQRKVTDGGDRNLARQQAQK